MVSAAVQANGVAMIRTLIARAQLEAQRWFLLRLQQFGQWIHPRYVKAPHLLVGERGEFEALFFLRRQGYTVVERRWRTPDFNGDLDLVAWNGDFLCIIEVKTRSTRDITPAAAAIDETKRRVLRQMARAYRRTLPRQPEPPRLRFDVVSVYLSDAKAECELVRAAFPLDPDPARNEQSGYGV